MTVENTSCGSGYSNKMWVRWEICSNSVILPRSSSFFSRLFIISSRHNNFFYRMYRLPAPDLPPHSLHLRPPRRASPSEDLIDLLNNRRCPNVTVSFSSPLVLYLSFHHSHVGKIPSIHPFFSLSTYSCISGTSIYICMTL